MDTANENELEDFAEDERELYEHHNIKVDKVRPFDKLMTGQAQGERLSDVYCL